jgi:hypothetical protein
MSTSKESLKVQIVPGAAALDLRTLIPGGPLPGGVFVNLRSSFKPTWYWSSEQLASSSYFAWSQGFSYGGQGDWTKVSKLRARAFRRLAL